jgi:tetratricopeptide (TPR) repeat protein
MKVKNKLVICLMVMSLFHCTPKVAEVIEEEQVAFLLVDPSKPCRTLDDLPPQYKEEAENAFVLYKDQMKQKRWSEALNIWKKAYELAPGSNGKVMGHFGDGVTIYSELSKQTDQLFLKQRYLDTIFMINKKFDECFNVDAERMAKRAFDYYYNFGDIIPEEEQWKTFTKAIDMNNGKMLYFVVNPFTKMLYDRVTEERISLDEGRKWANLIFKSIEDGTKNCKGQECESWEVVNSYAPDRLDALEAVDDFYDCMYYTKKYYALYKLTPDSCDVINQAYARILRGKCPADNPILTEIREVRNQKCVAKAVPVAAGPLRLAFDAYGEGRYKEAIAQFENFISTSTDDTNRFKYAMLIAKIYYGDLRNFPLSRKWANEAKKYNRRSGEPDLHIGKLYASSGPLCGPGRGFESQKVTWVAIDRFVAARNLDSSVAAEANGLIAQYSKYMPSSEDIFSRTLKKGSSYTVGCWINETTTVRTAD